MIKLGGCPGLSSLRSAHTKFVAFVMTGFMLQNQQISLFQLGTQNVNTYNIVEQANFAKKEFHQFYIL